MSFIINDIARLVVTWNMSIESQAQMVWHYKQVGSGTVTDQQMIDAAEASIEAAWLFVDNDISNTLAVSKLELLKWDFSNNRWDGLLNQVPSTLDGLAAGDRASHGVAALVKILTLANRRQARKFIPGMVEAVITNGFFTGATLVNMASFAGTLDQDITPGGIQCSFCSFNVDNTSPLFETASVAKGSVIAEATSAYQRRRKPGVGLT